MASVTPIADNEVFTWGNKSRGRLGNDDRDALSPCLIQVKVASLKLVSAAASNGGTLLAFGNID